MQRHEEAGSGSAFLKTLGEKQQIGFKFSQTVLNLMVTLLTSHVLRNLHRTKGMVLPTVVFVLGAPGAGKGTQSARIVEKFGFVHLSAGDLLRKEKSNPESKVGQLIAKYIKEGKIVPVKITCGLLEKAMNDLMEESRGEKNKFLIDGFPRNKDNLDGWNDAMKDKVNLNFVLHLECSEEICMERILDRGKTSGRTDDNLESLKKRFQTFINETQPIIQHYEKLGKVRNVKADREPDLVFDELGQHFA